MLYNIKPISLHRVFHGIRFKVNEDWESGKIPSFFLPVREGEISSRTMELNRTVNGVIFCGRFAHIVYTLRPDRAVVSARSSG